MQTSIANTLDFAGDEALLDKQAKKIFSHEAVLAPLMRMCIPEFAGYTDEFIIRNCFTEKPEISSYPVNQDEGVKLEGNQRVTQMNSEDSAAGERTIHYDIRFTAWAPGSGAHIKLIINLEIQVDDRLQYKVVTRGIYYGARLISAQYGTVFTKQEYQKLQKVYSIWICPESAEKTHSITEYRFQQIQKLGSVPAAEVDYDKLQVIVITLGPNGVESDHPLIRYLSLLLSREYPVEQKKQLLQDEYRIAMDQELEEEMRTVCNLGEGIARRSRDEGLAQGMSKVAQLMAKLCSLKKYQDVEKASNDPEYLQKLLKEYGFAEA